MSVPEAIGLAVAILMALGLVSLLAHAKMMEGGFDARRRRHVLISLWLLVFGLIALLVALRALSGGPAIGGSPTTGLWLGLQPRQVAVLVIALALVMVGVVGLRRILTPLQAAPPAAPAPISAADEEEP